MSANENAVVLPRLVEVLLHIVSDVIVEIEFRRSQPAGHGVNGVGWEDAATTEDFHVFREPTHEERVLLVGHRLAQQFGLGKEARAQ